jgi:hypothetical protein
MYTAISASLIIATSGKHQSAASGREDGTSKMGTLGIMLILLPLSHALGLLTLDMSSYLSSMDHREEPGVDVLPRDDLLCF